MDRNSTPFVLRPKTPGSRKAPQTPDTTSSQPDTDQKRQRRGYIPNQPLARRPRDENGNIILQLPLRHQNLISSYIPWGKKPQKKTLPHLPDEIWRQIFFFAAQEWQRRSYHFHLISYGRLLSLWQGCRCCELPVGLRVNRLARDMTMDVMRDNALPSDGKSHIVVKVMGHLMGLEIKDFGLGAIDEGFFRPEFEEPDDTDESKAITRRRA